MVSKNATIEVEIDGQNCDVWFGPLGRKLRSRFDYSKIRGRNASALDDLWGKS